MPKVNLDDEDAIRKLNDYLRILKPVAIEFKFAHEYESVTLRSEKDHGREITYLV